MRDILKRKFAEIDENHCCSSSSSPPSSLSSPASSEWESDGESSFSETQDFTPQSPSSPTTVPIRSILKRHNLSRGQSTVRFDQVTVFSFPRCQGFISVPSRGGATLGMVQSHITLQRYTVAEHALDQRHRRRERLRQRLREERFKSLKHELITSGAIDNQKAARLTADQVQGSDVDIHVSDTELEDGCFLQPYSSRQRQAVLLAAGVKHIDKEEKRQLHTLRLSREACGCDCQGFCEPETCACSLAGIKCQVDRFSFPCGCSKDSCGNTQGRIEFDSRRARTHYIHTVMRLELEQRLQDETLRSEDQTGLPEELQEYEDLSKVQPEQSVQDKGCPFGFTLEEDGLSLTMPATPSFHFIPDRVVVEENSCSSDTTESSCSSDSDTGEGLGVSQSLPEVDGGLTCALTLCENDTSSPCTTHSTTTDSMGTSTANTLTDNISRTSVTDYLDENANQDIFDDDSLEDFPNTPSPTVDFSLGGYMDLSLSSDSDLEFFDSDYPSGPLHSTFKGHRHPNGVHHLQLFSSVTLPQNESSTHLLESLIGLTEPSAEQLYSLADGQLL